MRENLSAPGTVNEWMRISRQALINLGYHNITKDPVYARLTAEYGYDENFLINIRTKEEGSVLLEFDVSSPKLIKQFQTAAAQVIRQLQNNKKEYIDEKKYGPEKTQVVNYRSQSSQDKDSRYADTEYIAEEGDYIEETRYLPDETLTLKEYHRNKDKRELRNFKENFEYYFNRLWVVWLMLFLLPPFGIFLLWYFHRFNLFMRLLVTIFFLLFFFLVWINILGIDTGFNRAGLQRFYETQEYRWTRFFNDIDNARGLNNPNPTETVPTQ